jgi:hypothetical protein
MAAGIRANGIEASERQIDTSGNVWTVYNFQNVQTFPPVGRLTIPDLSQIRDRLQSPDL